MVDYKTRTKLIKECNIFYKCKTHYRGLRLPEESRKLNFDRFFILFPRKNVIANLRTYYSFETILGIPYR